jgi:hypothetical protein
MLLRLSRSKAYDVENKILYSISVDYTSRGIDDSMSIYFNIYRHNYDGTYERIYKEFLADATSCQDNERYYMIIDWIEKVYKRGDRVINIQNIIRVCLDSNMNSML